MQESDLCRLVDMQRVLLMLRLESSLTVVSAMHASVKRICVFDTPAMWFRHTRASSKEGAALMPLALECTCIDTKLSRRCCPGWHKQWISRA